MAMMDGHLRARLMQNRILGEPDAFDAPVAVSPSLSSESSFLSDLDTESTGSFYESGITLGNLIGLQPELDRQEQIPSAGIPGRNSRRKWWNLCGNAEDCHEDNLPPSLGQFLEVERRAAASSRRERMYFNAVYDDYSAGETALNRNPLFGHDRILAPQSPSDAFSMPLSLPFQWFSADPANSIGGSARPPRYTRDCNSLESRSATFFFGICGGNLAVRMWIWVRRLVSGKHVKCS